MNKTKIALVCPLNWGLGHATRCVPIVHNLQQKGFKIIIAGEIPVTTFFKVTFPGITTAFFPGPKISYQKAGPLWIAMLFQLPNLLRWQKRERQLILRLAKKYQPDCIVSDNRYGARVKGIRSILITHQLMIKLPCPLSFIEYPLHRIIRSLILPFDECIIPDHPKSTNLSGELSHRYPLPPNAKFIGPQSRFMICKNEVAFGTPPHVLVILSGPEPQRTILKNKLVKVLKRSRLNVWIMTGRPDIPTQHITNGNLTFISHLTDSTLKSVLLQTPVIISRSGYSTIMDLTYLNRTAILIPTPGQPEQIYLSKYLKNCFYILKQSEIENQLITRIKSLLKQSSLHSESLLSDTNP
jgi:uncharacterized protein (TIGR00661 family)